MCVRVKLSLGGSRATGYASAVHRQRTTEHRAPRGARGCACGSIERPGRGAPRDETSAGAGGAGRARDARDARAVSMSHMLHTAHS
eukprot:scaffold88048_cov69-Phaeocystis_antarctica.AAC.13